MDRGVGDGDVVDDDDGDISVERGCDDDDDDAAIVGDGLGEFFKVGKGV